jgi:hypothetical protein
MSHTHMIMVNDAVLRRVHVDVFVFNSSTQSIDVNLSEKVHSFDFDVLFVYLFAHVLSKTVSNIIQNFKNRRMNYQLNAALKKKQDNTNEMIFLSMYTF